ncbi:MAG: hypothetical protein D6738_03945 [Acidobacteria bacterium]|nr:MAG: hypothetical protein D6738_03945 [Acidobacteriota bacterium]
MVGAPEKSGGQTVRPCWSCVAARVRPPGGLSAALLLLLLALALPATFAQQPAGGGLRGAVLDKDFDVPLAGARVTIVELQRSATTDTNGNFLLENVPPGRYTLTVAKSGYERTVLSDIVVAAGRLTDVRVALTGQVYELDELVVSGTDFLSDTEIGLLEIRAEAITLQDSISAELISKAGASDVAGALKLVVGATVVDGKYATVRGLSDRYTGTTLNGVRVPSADPRRRAVQVDLFPTGTIESVTVRKTFTPDQLGDFTGGGVDIRTRSIPDGPLFKISISSEYDENATGNDRFLTYRGGGVPADGTAGSQRALPAIAPSDFPPLPRPSIRPTDQQVADATFYDRLTRAFVPVIGTRRQAPSANSGFRLVAGNRWQFHGDDVLGVIGALSWSHKYDFYENGISNRGGKSGATSPIAIVEPRSDSRGKDELLLGGLATVVYRPSENHEFALRAILNRGAEDEARFQVERTGDTSVEQNQALTYTERNLLSVQLQGRHAWPGALHLGEGDQKIELDWSVSDNSTEQDQPDVRFFRNTFDLTNNSARMPRNSTDSQNTRRIFRNIQEDNLQTAVNAVLEFSARNERTGRVKLGLYHDDTDRTFFQRSFTYTFPFQLGSFLNQAVRTNRGWATFLGDGPDALWTDVFLEPQRIGLAPVRCEPPANPFIPSSNCAAPNQLLWTLTPVGTDVDYGGSQTIDAGYAMMELPLGKRWTVIAGARYETTELSILPVSPFTGLVEAIEQLPDGSRSIVRVPAEQGAALIDEGHWLPALSASWELVPGTMKLRFSGSRTIARPTFRELAPVLTEEFIAGDEFLGNPDLEISRITNWDVRWEWFPRPGDILAASAFYKSIKDPIEVIAFGFANRNFVQPVNYETGSLKGIELEARAGLDRFSKRLAGLAAGINFTWLDSTADVPRFEQQSLADFGLDVKSRSLQGQPSYLLNANVTWDHERWGTSVGLFYTVTGDILLTGAARGLDEGRPDVIQKARGNLDLTASQEIGEHLSLSVKARNLLAGDRETFYSAPDGEEVTRSVRETARTYSFSVGYTW